MSDAEKLWTNVDNYFSELFVGADAVLGNTLASSATAGVPFVAGQS